jgi:phage shock protein C
MRLMRSRSDRMIAGVCGGLGHYFGIDPVIVRLIFLVLTVLTMFVPPLLYVVLWFIMPDEAEIPQHPPALPPDARFDPMTGQPLSPGQPMMGQTVSLRETNAPPPVATPSSRNRTLGIVLLIIGTLLLIDSISDRLMWIFGIDLSSMLLPLLLVGVGIYLLRRKTA